MGVHNRIADQCFNVRRLRKPQDGLFTGTVDGYDTSNNTYRITFDRTGLGTHSIPDHDVLSTQPPETMPLTTFTSRGRPRPPAATAAGAAAAAAAAAAAGHHQQFGLQQHHLLGSPYSGGSPLRSSSFLGSSMVAFSPQLANDPLLGGLSPKGKVSTLTILLLVPFPTLS